MKYLFPFLIFIGIYGSASGTPPKDTLYYSIYLKTVNYNGKIYTANDSAAFNIDCNIPTKLPDYILNFRQDSVRYFRNGYMMQISIRRIGQPSESLMQGHDVDITILPKGQTATAMDIHSYSVQIKAGHFKKGISYIIDTLDYDCGSHYFNIDAINENIRGTTGHIRTAHFVRGDPNTFQNRAKIDSVLKIVHAEIEANKDLAELNKGKTIERKNKKPACPDTITYSVEYWSEKHQYKSFEFDSGGDLFRTVISNHPIRFFFKTCEWAPYCGMRHCTYHIVGRKTETKVILNP